MSNNQLNVNLEIKTFIDQGIGLINYYYNEKDHLKNKKTEIIGKDCYICKNKESENIYTKENLDDYDPKKSYILFRIRKSFVNNDFEIIKPVRINNHQKFLYHLNYYAWYVIKSEPIIFQNNNEKYILNENDIIKFGNKAYEIIKKKNKNKSVLIKNSYNISGINEKEGSIFDINLKISQYKVHKNQINLEQNENIEKDIKKFNCEECKNDEASINNPLLHLCLCNNYFIHFNCLKKQLRKQIQTKKNQKNNVITYNCPKFNCNKCYTPYPLQFKIEIDKNDKLYELIDFEKDIPKESDYIILESLNFIKDNKNNIKTIFIVKLVDKESITIGSAEDNDIVDNIGIISRKHAIIKYDEGIAIIENKSETYGTFALIKGNIKILKEDINFQVGNSYITAKLK